MPARNVVVVGASSGIGEQLAYSYAKGNTLVLLARSAGELDRVAGECLAKGAAAVHTVPVDIVQLVATREAMAAVSAHVGGQVDVAVLAAGLGSHQYGGTAWDLSEATLDVYRRTMEVNFFGALNAIALLLPLLDAGGSKRRGQLITLNSVSGLIGLPARAAYCASKFALAGLTEALRADEAYAHVDVTDVFMVTVSGTKLREKGVQTDAGGEPTVAATERHGHSSSEIPVADCVATIVAQASARPSRIYVPSKSRLVATLKHAPVVGSRIEQMVWSRSRL